MALQFWLIVVSIETYPIMLEHFEILSKDCLLSSDRGELKSGLVGGRD